MKTILLNIAFTLIVKIAFSQYNIELINKSEKAVLKIVDSQSKELIGTGFLISSDGLALSCYHVFNNKSNLGVQNISGEYFEVDSVLGFSENDDYILFKLKNEQGLTFPYLEISGKLLDKGAEVLAIGHVAENPYLATFGTIAGYRIDKEEDKGKKKEKQEIFFTAPVFYASSGSPLITANDGQVVGIVKELTIYKSFQVPNINVCVDITSGLNNLKNTISYSYNCFLDSVINKDEFDIDSYFSKNFETEEEKENAKNDSIIYNLEKYTYYIEESTSILVDQLLDEARTCALLNYPKKAERKIKMAMKLSPYQKEEFTIKYVDVLMLSNQFKKAEKILSKAVVTYPDNYRMWQKLGDVCQLRCNNNANAYYEKAYNIREEKLKEMWYEWY